MGNCCQEDPSVGAPSFPQPGVNPQLIGQMVAPAHPLPVNQQGFPPLQGVPPQIQQLSVGQVIGNGRSASNANPALPMVPSAPNVISANVPGIPQAVPPPALSNKTIITTQPSNITQGRDLIRESLNDSIYFGLKNPSLITTSHPSSIHPPGSSIFHFGQQLGNRLG